MVILSPYGICNLVLVLFYVFVFWSENIFFFSDKSKVKELSSTLKIKYEGLDEARATVLITFMYNFI